MTDNIKLPPLPPWMERYEIPDDDFEGGRANLDSRMRSYARETVLLNAQGVPDGMVLVNREALNIVLNAHDDEVPESLYLRPAAAAPAEPQPAQQPLTEAAIQQLSLDMPLHRPDGVIEFTRVIERAHGIYGGLTVNRWYCPACKAWCYQRDTGHYLWCPGRVSAAGKD